MPGLRSWTGRELHWRGPAAAKVLSPWTLKDEIVQNHSPEVSSSVRRPVWLHQLKRRGKVLLVTLPVIRAETASDSWSVFLEHFVYLILSCATIKYIIPVGQPRVHAFMPGFSVCTVKLLLLVWCFSDKLNYAIVGHQVSKRPKRFGKGPHPCSTPSSALSPDSCSKLASVGVMWKSYDNNNNNHLTASFPGQPG